MRSLIKRLLGSMGIRNKALSSAAYEAHEGRPRLNQTLPDVTMGGLRPIAMVGDYDRSRLPVSNEEIVLFESSGAPVTAACGHASHARLVFEVYGLKIEGSGQLTCPECGSKELREITIRCALCGLPILPGDGVSLYDIGGSDIRSDIAYKVGMDQVLGCMSWDCSMPGSYAGVWGGPEQGFVSAFE